MQILVAGPHGGQNLGDEFIFSCIAKDIIAQGHTVVGTSIDSEFSLQAHGVRTLPMLDIRKRHFAVLRELERFDALVVAGGDQLQEGRHLGYPLWGLLPNVAHLVRVASSKNIPCMIWGVGVGEIRTPVGKWMLRKWVRKATVVTVRDHKSYATLQGLGFPSSRLFLAADPVFQVPRYSRAESRRYLGELVGQQLGDEPLLVVAAANDRGTDSSYLTPMLMGVKAAARQIGAKILIMSMHPHPGFDLEILSHPLIAESRDFIQLPLQTFSSTTLPMVFAGADTVIASRMHALIIAASQGTPWVNISRTVKMDALAEMFGMSALKTSSLEATSVCRASVEAYELGRAKWQQEFDPILQELSSRASVSSLAFRDMLSSNK